MKKKIIPLIVAATLSLTTTVFAYTDVYTVKSGDTVYSLAKKYGVTVKAIANLNKLEDPAKIYIDDKLYIPVPGNTNTGTSSNKPSTTVTTPPKNGTGSATYTDPNGDTTIDNNNNNSDNDNAANNNNNNSSNNGDSSGDLTAPSDNVNEDVAQQILDLVNEQRVAAGVSELTLSTDVSSVAQVKADDMAQNGYFDHNSPTYGSPFDMLTSFGVSYRTAGENIAKGQQTAEAVMNAWMNSSGHKENILNSSYKQLGVGYSANNGSPVWVQMFIAQ